MIILSKKEIGQLVAKWVRASEWDKTGGDPQLQTLPIIQTLPISSDDMYLVINRITAPDVEDRMFYYISATLNKAHTNVTAKPRALTKRLIQSLTDDIFYHRMGTSFDLIFLQILGELGTNNPDMQTDLIKLGPNVYERIFQPTEKATRLQEMMWTL